MRYFIFAVLLGALGVVAGPARGAVLLDRIVAVVDGKTIYRSDVLARAVPRVGALDEAARKDPKRVDQVNRAMLDRMIDEVFILEEAARLHLTAEDSEIDHAVDAVARNNGLDRAGLVAAAEKQGITMKDYRAEIGRQLLEGKWLQLKVRGRVVGPTTGTEQEKTAAYMALLEIERQKALKELRSRAHVEVRW